MGCEKDDPIRIRLMISKKKIDNSIDFLRDWEEKIISIFRLRSCGEVGLSLGPNEAVFEIYN